MGDVLLFLVGVILLIEAVMLANNVVDKELKLYKWLLSRFPDSYWLSASCIVLAGVCFSFI